MATELSGVKTPIYQEDVDFNSGISEQMLTKIGKNVMHIHNKQFMHWNFRFLGPAHPISTGEDGAMTVPFNFEICAFSWSFRVNATSNDYIYLDVHEVDSSGVDQGSILSDRLAIRGTAITGNHAGYYYNFIENTGTTYSFPSVVPTFTNDAARLFNAGTTLRVDLDQCDDFEDVCFNIFYRPQ